MPALGDGKPSALMDKMLVLLGAHNPCFLFCELFLDRLPEDICKILVNSGIQDPCQLAQAADRLHQSGSSATCAVQAQHTKKKDILEEALPREPTITTATTTTDSETRPKTATPMQASSS